MAEMPRALPALRRNLDVMPSPVEERPGLLVRDPFRYTEESVARLRKHLDDDHALVHPIGGIADQTSPEDYVAFLRAVKSTRAIGYSVYDFNTTSSSAWTYLRGAGLPT